MDSESFSVIGRPAAGQEWQNKTSKGPAKKLMLWKQHLPFNMKKLHIHPKE